MVGSILSLGLVSFAIAWMLTWMMIRVAPRIGFVDKPGGRKIHANPKPLGGGVAIYWGFVVPLIAAIAGNIFISVGNVRTLRWMMRGKIANRGWRV